jgi:hypothetical protein
MAEAHVCPRCEGEKRVHNARSGQAEDCPTCGGTGVVWDRRTEEASDSGSSKEHLDLTYRG